MEHLEGSLALRGLQTSSSRAPNSRRARLGVGLATLLAGVGLAGTAHAKPFMEYVKQTPTVAPLSSATWGVAGVLPRDISNGIESAKGAGVHPDYYYWDGQIIRAKDGKYHLFMSTFSGNTNFGTGWLNSDAYHAISQTNVLGPYQRQDYVYSNNGSHKGHNVSAVELPDGTYAVVVSEIVPFTIYKSSSLDGPWTGCSPTSEVSSSNVSLFPRHDGKFQIVERNGNIAIADTLCGTYKKQKPTCAYPTANGDTIYPKRTSTPGVSNPTYAYQEDPHIWRSGGTYHVIYSGSGDRVGWHVYSPDGLNWKDNGYAWSPREYQKLFCYEGGTPCTQWYKMERPGVVLEDGHPTHITWAVSDVDKDNMVLPGTPHGTKIVVVPFDGVAFDKDFGVGGADAGTDGPVGTGGSSGTDGGIARDAGASGGAGPGGAGGRGSGGASASGGSSPSGGAGGKESPNTGGSSSTGGRATGGTTTSTGGSRTGGSNTGGITATGGQTGGSTGPGGDDGSASGCSCTVEGREGATNAGLWFVLGLILLSVFRRGASRKTR